MGLLDKILKNTPEEDNTAEDGFKHGLLKKALESFSGENNYNPDKINRDDILTTQNNEDILNITEEKISDNASHSLLRSAEKILSSNDIDDIDGSDDNSSEFEDITPPLLECPEVNSPILTNTPAKEENEVYTTPNANEVLDFTNLVLYDSPLLDFYCKLLYISKECNAEKIFLVNLYQCAPETGRISFSKNIDITTTERFCPDGLFLNSLIKENGLHKIEDLEQFQGFFSNKEFNSIKNIYVFKFDNGWLFFIDSFLNANETNLDKLILSKEKILSELSLPFELTSPFITTHIKTKDSVSIPLFIKDSIEQGMICNLFKININVLLNELKEKMDLDSLIYFYNEVLSKIKISIGNCGILNKYDDFSFVIGIFSKQEIDFDLYIQQMEKTLSPYIGNKYNNYIEIIDTLTTVNKEKILTYITKGFISES